MSDREHPFAQLPRLTVRIRGSSAIGHLQPVATDRIRVGYRMRTLLRLLVSLAAGTVAAWYLLVGLCNMPSLTFSVACGHNGPMWLPLFVPLAVWACWAALGTLAVFDRKRRGGVAKSDA